MCIAAKGTKKPHSAVGRDVKKIGDLVHSDICGPFRTDFEGNKYYVSFVDDYSGFCQVHLMKKKSEVLGHFKTFNERFKNVNGRDICNLRSDNGLEYVNHAMKLYCQERGIREENFQLLIVLNKKWYCRKI